MSRSLKHVAIREYVRNLVDGSAPGTAAPSERDLVDRFGVARMTVRQALDALVGEGVLERFPGRGTFVATPRRTASGVTSFSEEMARRGIVAESRTLAADQLPAGENLARALQVQAGVPVVHWRRLRMTDGRPVCLSDAYLDRTRVPGLLECLPTSLYDDLAARGLRPSWAEDMLAAATATPEEAALLEIPSGSAVLRHHRRALAGDAVVEVSRTVYRGDAYTLNVQLCATR
ncbi:GntR family transcriptional regulator [Pimelobacter simplex]|uniref:GntR family transcriptional regulator n=1 Tax=Nocardioides simplex TaxID=2045 RepID=UPI0021503435|nr:GntR family transcriptional regulator [Pimelobacter simplex]UUW92076.1 GntR family transcriptional regulator [Pimelobacter simplex]UUW95903.1 GntR family transcriptional regulator [Pimelobacter simplex]